MPLLDHFHPPLSRTHPWRGFHGAWAAAMARLLNAGVLPPGYYAVPFLDRDGPVEIDVAALREFDPAGPASGTGGAQPWIPAAPGWRSPSSGRRSTRCGSRCSSTTGTRGWRRRWSWSARGTKTGRGRGRRSRPSAPATCGAGAGWSWWIRSRHAGRTSTPTCSPPSGRMRARRDRRPCPSCPIERSAGTRRAGCWPGRPALEVGQPLPTVPLWVGADLAVPLDLEASHSATCVDLRIRQAG
jgi:hypothetical protein